MAMRSIPHRTVQRGFSYFQVKRVVVAPKGKLSLQRHLHRPNIGCRCAVRPEVTIGHKVSTVHENESVYPFGTVHRLVNAGKIALELAKVKSGSYL